MLRFDLRTWRRQGSGHQSLRATIGKTGGRRVIFHVLTFHFTYIRKGHYIVSDYVDKVHNRIAPTFPWDVSLLIYSN